MKSVNFTRRDIESNFIELTDFTDLSETFYYQTKFFTESETFFIRRDIESDFIYFTDFTDLSGTFFTRRDMGSSFIDFAAGLMGLIFSLYYNRLLGITFTIPGANDFTSLT